MLNQLHNQLKINHVLFYFIYLFQCNYFHFVRLLLFFFSQYSIAASFNVESLGLWGLPQPMRFSASRPALPVRWFLGSNLNEIQSAPYIHAHASWSQGQSVQQIDFPVHWTPLKKAAENKSPTIYNGRTPESNQSVGSLPTASLLSSLASLQLLIISLPSLAGYKPAVDQILHDCVGNGSIPDRPAPHQKNNGSDWVLSLALNLCNILHVLLVRLSHTSRGGGGTNLQLLECSLGHTQYLII